MTNSKSKIFDSVRIKPRRSAAVEAAATHPGCDWEGCENPGLHKAPKGARSEGEFHSFCLEHVRHYNKAYNYFADMNDDEIADHANKMNAPGSRETWAFGSNAHGKSNPQPRPSRPRQPAGRQFHDVNHLFARLRSRAGGNLGADAPEREITLTGQDRAAFEVLGLETRKPSSEIKSAYKALVKLHHPDANGGDRGSEDRLRSIIAAYNHLKSRGFV
ncbi:MAG TPA: DnaJ domain-containing protein [Pelagibacterium sp.]|uniref:J domain-containing protein n=1 Tax=Pelagibacterium sp. TaxID=1967288 RepID=UPI002CCD532D|nr:DnaJ domain-containing protein [Pelagibacterium sp.]HWJ87124.1 DnaJ domain-containing protein [Pelagibacterium sp.]